MKQLSTKQTNTIYFIFILGIAFLIRIVGLGLVPFGINQDEAMGAMDALALAQYSTDRFGTYLPVHFEAWGYGQMSVLLAYCMVPFIKLFGFSILTIRLPLALISTLSIYIIYKISQYYFSEKMSLIIMALTAINPWQIMQSRWALDCNVFPHFFLLAFYFLLLGLEKSRYLYISMIFFGLTFYAYGIAIYTVPAFLCVFAAFCLWKKQLPLTKILLSILIFTLIALPEVIVMFINLVGLDTITTPFFTMQYFPESIRSSDILLMDFSFYQLYKNCLSLLTQAFLQFPDHLFNSLPAFGPLYHLSTPFVFIGIYAFTKRLFTSKDLKQQTKDLALWGFLITGIWAGIVTYEVNINRINIIFYPLIILCGYGLYTVYTFLRKPHYKLLYSRTLICGYSVYFILFCSTYFTSFAEEIQVYFNVDFLEAVQTVDELEEYDTLYITGNMGWQFNSTMAEILTQYSCSIDALYLQGITNIHQDRELLAYIERYQFMEYNTYPYAEGSVLYLVHESELEAFPYEYTILLDLEQFKGITID
ncbi:MAG: glycosyltransferase family 39 protein [Lachnospiraceae bacterium]